MKRLDDADPELPEPYDRPIDLDLLSEAIVTTDSYRHPIYSGQLVGIVVRGVRYMAQAAEFDDASGLKWQGFIVLTECEIKGKSFFVREVEWCDRLSAYEESIARLGGYGVK